MDKYVRYLWYVLRHKWYVFVAAARLGIVWRGLVHDLSKFLPSEFIPYARHFYGRNSAVTTGDAAFSVAWLKHQHRNPHHWQYWVLENDDDGRMILPIPEVYIREMVADWRGAGAAQGNRDVIAWYVAHYRKIVVAPETRQRVSELLGQSEVDRAKELVGNEPRQEA